MVLSELRATDPEGGDAGAGFLVRDVIRFMAVGVLLDLLFRSLDLFGFFPSPDAYVAGTLLGRFALFYYLIWLIRDRRDAWPETGATRAGRWWAWPLGLALYLGYCRLLPVIADLNHVLMVRLHQVLGWDYSYEPQSVMLALFSDEIGGAVRAALVFFVVLAGPLMEELAFRGMGLDAYRRRGGLARALVWTSLLFGLYHFRLDLVIPLGLLGLVFGLARAFSRAIWCPVFLHCLHNAFALLTTAQEFGLFPAWEDLMRQ